MATEANLKIYRQSSPDDKYVKTAGGILIDTDAPSGSGGGSSGGSGGSGEVLIKQETLLADAATYSITIPSGYRDIRIVVRGSCINTDVSYSRPRIRFNGDTAANYDWARGNFTNGGFSSEHDGGGGGAINTAIDFGLLPSGAPDYANARGMAEIRVFNYLDAAGYKAITYEASATATGVYFRMSGAGEWKNLAPITSVDLFFSNGSGVATSLKAGSVISVYGVSDTASTDILLSDIDLVSFFNTDGSKITASTTYAQVAPQSAFFGQGGTGGWITAAVNTGWLKIEFPLAVVMKSYALTPWSPDTFPGRSPKTWTFEGSNDDATWDVLDTQTLFTGWTRYQRKLFTTTNTKAYKFYKMNVTLNGGDSYMGVSGIWLYGTAKTVTSSSGSRWSTSEIPTDVAVQTARTINFATLASLSSYAWTNQGTATDVIQRNRLYMTAPSNGGETHSKRLLTPPSVNQVPAAPWCVQVPTTLYAVERFSQAGIYIKNTANGKGLSASIQVRDDAGKGYMFNVTTMTNETTGVTDLAKSAAESSGVIAIAFDGTTFDFYYSPDGQDWPPVPAVSQAAATFIGAGGTYEWSFFVDSLAARKSGGAFKNAVILNQVTPVPHGLFV